MKIKLTPEKRVELDLLHSMSSDRDICDRIKAVLLTHKGWSTKMIAQALIISESSVKSHLQDYIQLEKLQSEKVSKK